jgi:small nuclear ribonucleoprotein G
MDKKLFIQLNGSRKIIGILRGYDVFLNLVLEEVVEEKPDGEKVKVGTTVSTRVVELISISWTA